MNERRNELLAELRENWKNNPLERYNHPRLPKVHKKQLEFHAHIAPPLGVKLLLASNRSGKTVCGVADNIIQLVDERLVPDHLKAYKKWHGPVKIWVGAPKNENHFNSTIPLFRRFLPVEALIEGKWGKSFKSQPNPRITLANGSEVAFKTYDQDLDAWAGAEIHRVHWDEEPNGANAVDLRTEAQYRLASTAGDELITMTPVLGAYSWVNDEVWARRDEPKIFVLKMKIWDNPWNSKEVVDQLVEEAKRKGSEVYRTRIEAEFVHLGGLFFDEFSERHVVDGIEPSFLKGQEIVVSIDPGRRKTGVTWTAFDKENDALVFDEFFPSEMVVPDVAEEIRNRNRFWGIKDATYVIDPSSRNRSQINADQVEAAYSRADIYCEHAQNSRPAGILEVKRRLQAKPEPSLLITRKCPELIQQIERYARDPKSKDEWAAVPQNDRIRFDLVDTVRYAVMSRTFYGPDEEEPARTAFQPNFQPPYREERIEDAPPMGAFT